MALLGACAGPGELTKIPVEMPNGQRATILAHDQQVPDWMLDRDQLALNYVVKNDVSNEQLKAVAAVEKSCRLYTGTVRPNNLVAVVLNGALYFATGFPFGGLAATTAFEGAHFVPYGKYVGTVSGGGGIANGIVQLGGQTYTFENCGQEVLNMFPEYKVHVLQKSPY